MGELSPFSKKEEGFYFYSGTLEVIRRCLSEPKKHMQNFVRMSIDFMSFSDSEKMKNNYF